MPLTSSGLYTPFLTGSTTSTGGGGGGIVTVAGPAKKDYWRVIHRDHAGVALGEEYPSSPEFALYLGKVGYLSYDLDRSSILAVKQNCEPYATDYELYFGNTLIQSGIHTDIEASSLEDHTFKISGKDWLHWFEGQQWYFDPTSPVSNLYSATNRDAFTIFEDWLTAVQSYPDTIQFTYSNGTCGVLTNAKIDVNDTEDMYQKFVTLAQGVGFEFEISPQKVVKLYYPQMVKNTDEVLEIGVHVYDLTYHNKGPTATQILVTGQGPSSKLGTIVVDSTARAKYRRWMGNEDLGTIPDAATLTSRSVTAMQRNSVPSLEFSCKLIPDFVPDFFSRFQIGDKIHVHGDIGWSSDVHELTNEKFRLVSIVGSPNDEGDQEYELGFDDGTVPL